MPIYTMYKLLDWVPKSKKPKIINKRLNEITHQINEWDGGEFNVSFKPYTKRAIQNEIIEFKFIHKQCNNGVYIISFYFF